MGKNKLRKFAENETFDHVFQPTLDEVRDGSFAMKGKWAEKVFRNENPIVLELGCGLGEYSLELGRRYPHKNFIGVDIKGARIWRGAKSVEEESLNNVAFIRTRIEFIEFLFDQEEIDEIWITFPDPQPQKRRIKKRLTSPMFLKQYGKILKPGGLVHLKTDSELMYEYTHEIIAEEKLQILEESNDVHSGNSGLSSDTQEVMAIRTKYETMFSAKGFTIKYVKFCLS